MSIAATSAVIEDPRRDGVTLAEVQAWPATVDIPTANTAIGLSKSHGYELAKRGEYPARVLKVGGRYRVVTASIVRLLSEGEA